MKQQQEIEEIWGELQHILRRLSDIYGINYNTMFTAVKKAAEEVIANSK